MAPTNNISVMPVLICSLFCAVSGTAAPGVPATAADMVNRTRSNPIKFMENIGQLTDEVGNTVPGVFYKGSSPGMDVYITNKGITYVFLKFEEEEEREAATQPVGVEPGMKLHTYEWSTVDLNLKGANIR